MTTHTLKSWPRPFQDVWDGKKRFEWRLNDRDYQVGDTLILCEFLPDTGRWTGREVKAKVTYLQPGGEFGIPEGYCIMGFRPSPR